jgi:hypothetical protein
MNEKITRRVNKLTIFFSFFIRSAVSPVGDALKTKNLSASIKLDIIKTIKMITSHSISILTRDIYDN